MEGSNDNDDPWQSLAALTAKALDTHAKKNERAAGDGDGSRRDKEKRAAHEKYVDQRLKDLRAFEALFRDAMKRRR